MVCIAVICIAKGCIAVCCGVLGIIFLALCWGCDGDSVNHMRGSQHKVEVYGRVKALVLLILMVTRTLVS